ncbi:lipoprotein [Virgisporangium aurantiacum]|uniref:DUF3558 domain-containing protein n=1 Tax=Virgisporangium aurantiacum TaxID=175570 RepID=A0A8J3ZCE2_9ACTN|nr:lipoprotein [Virgisporangium aurantiacum]GIJ61337.1 hypothetical protein Vau01_088530 [Virgisporangium aurantiacum]
MRRLLLPVLTLLALAACGSDPDPTVAPPAGSPAASVTATASAPDVPTENWNDPQPADAAGTSYPACAVPAIFDLADKWTARAVPADAAKLLGPHTLACEIDGKAAGVIGFIRVFRATGTDIRAALLAQVGDKAAGLRTREFTAAPGPGREVAFGPADKPERAFAVATGTETVIVHWSGLDADEHTAGLPAYLLAQASFAKRGG